MTITIAKKLMCIYNLFIDNLKIITADNFKLIIAVIIILITKSR